MMHWTFALATFLAGMAISFHIGKKACLDVVEIYQGVIREYRKRYDEMWDAHIALVRQVMGDDEVNRIFDQHGFGHDGRRK